MAIEICDQNKWVNYSVSTTVQIILIFTFLTIFFFIYVIKVEKSEFRRQIELIVDNITEDVGENIAKLIKKVPEKEKKELKKALIYLIDKLQKEEQKASKSAEINIKKNNSSLFRKSGIVILIFFSLLVVFTLSMFVVGYCIPIKSQVIQGLIIVLFIAVVEFSFLTLIAQNYISARPNEVKREFAQAVIEWINKHKKLV